MKKVIILFEYLNLDHPKLTFLKRKKRGK